MECILWNEYQITFTHFLDFVTNFKVNIAFNDNEYLVVVFLSMKCIAAVTNYSDIGSQMLAIKNESPFDRIVFCRFICFK